jgi:hypothetical protein
MTPWFSARQLRTATAWSQASFHQTVQQPYQFLARCTLYTAQVNLLLLSTRWGFRLQPPSKSKLQTFTHELHSLNLSQLPAILTKIIGFNSLQTNAAIVPGNKLRLDSFNLPQPQQKYIISIDWNWKHSGLLYGKQDNIKPTSKFIYFIYGLFNDTVSRSENTALNDRINE